MKMSVLAWIGLSTSLGMALGCPGSDDVESGHPTGAVCDPTITYEADIVPLMNAFCTDCHATSVPPAARRGAPTDHNFDSEVAMLETPQHVIDYAGAGPLGVNTAMPPEGESQPTLADRHLLASYLTCYADGGAPPHTHSHEGE